MALMKIRTASENSEVDYSLQKLIDAPGGLEKLATEKLPPFIREVRDYESFARKILFVHQITEVDTHIINGEPYVYYPKDFKSHAAIYGDDGEIPQLVIEGDGVDVGVFTLASDDTIISLKRLMVQKYNYLERIRELSGQEMGRLEDTHLMELANVLIAANPGQVYHSLNTLLTKEDLVMTKKTLTQWDVPAACYVMNQTRMDDILLWGREELDELTRREILETGVKYQLWNDIKIITSRAVPTNIVYCFAEKDLVGRMPILKDITVKLTETTNRLEKGMFMFQFLGMYMASHKAMGQCILAG